MSNRLPKIQSNPLISELDPIIITAPVIRSGTTLLQRLLCSSSRTLIYGELVAQDLEFFVNLYTFKAQEYTYRRHLLARNLQQVLEGDVNDWIPDLMPDVDAYLNAFGQSAFSGIAYCRDYAQHLGRPIWGFKHPGWKPAFIQLLRALMPQARFISVTRDLGACVRSAKAQSVLNSLGEVQEFCRAWAEGADYWRSVADDPAVLLLSYEELTAHPTETLARLAEFTGANDIKPAVLQRKINTWTGDKALVDAENGYLPPVELTAAEQQIVDEMAAQQTSVYA
jgi:hypothetical protein